MDMRDYSTLHLDKNTRKWTSLLLQSILNLNLIKLTAIQRANDKAASNSNLFPVKEIYKYRLKLHVILS
jgi:predicted ATP-grasp superfamily ATP-dependent carboligase